MMTLGNKFYVDPPSGWMYGFPRIYDAKNGQTMAEWLVECGYPESDAAWAADHCRMWATQPGEENEAK